jgi:hypothetical protein
MRTTESKTKDDVKSDEPELLTPHECAQSFGIVGTLRVPLGETYYTDARHPMARTIHGWDKFEYHEGKPFRLSLADYKAALKAAESFPYAPHKPALTKYAAEQYRRAAK